MRIEGRESIWLSPCLDSLGKRIPLFGQIMGRAFRMGRAGESASQNIGLKRDALSQCALKRKPHSTLERGLRKIWPVIWFGLEYA